MCLLISWQNWLVASWPARIVTLICLAVTLGDGEDWATRFLISTCLSKMLPVEFQEQQRVKVKIWKHFFKFLLRSHLVSSYLPEQITRIVQNQGAEKSYCKEQIYKRIESLKAFVFAINLSLTLINFHIFQAIGGFRVNL